MGTNIIQFIDSQILLPVLSSLSFAVPRFEQFNLSNYLAYGYTIDDQVLLINLTVAISFSLGMTILGYFCFKTREIAAA
jgi:hypothetical protein